MDRLVPVLLGYGNIVFETGDQRRVSEVEQAEYLVALYRFLDDNTDRKQVKYFLYAHPFPVHLQVGGVVVFDTSEDIKLPFFKSILQHHLCDFLDKRIQFELKVLCI